MDEHFEPRSILEATNYLSTPTGADLGGVITKLQYSNVAEKADSIESLETLPKVDDKDMFTAPSRLDEAQVVIINEWQQVKSNFDVIKHELERLGATREERSECVAVAFRNIERKFKEVDTKVLVL